MFSVLATQNILFDQFQKVSFLHTPTAASLTNYLLQKVCVLNEDCYDEAHYCQTPDLPNSQVQFIGKSGRHYIWVVVRCLLFVRNAGRNAGYNRLIPF